MRANAAARNQGDLHGNYEQYMRDDEHGSKIISPSCIRLLIIALIFAGIMTLFLFKQVHFKGPEDNEF